MNKTSSFVSTTDFSLNCIILRPEFYYQVKMTFQFSQKMQDSQYPQLQKENIMLRDYSLALEKENKSKNEERKVLEIQIQQLNQRLKQKAKNQASTQGSSTQSFQYSQLVKKFTAYQQRFLELQANYDKILLQNASLKQKLKYKQQIKLAESTFLIQKDELKSTIRDLQVKIFTLEAQIFSYQSEINDLKQFQRRSRKIYEDPQHIQLKLNLQQRQLLRKSQEIIKHQSILAMKQEQQKRQRKALTATIQDLQMKLKQKGKTSVEKQQQGSDVLQKQIMSLQFKNQELIRQLQIKSSEIQVLKSQVSQKGNDISKNQELMRQIKMNQDEILKVRKEITQKISSSLKNEYLLKQISDLQEIIAKLKQQVSEKNTFVVGNQELNLKLAAKMGQIVRLKSEVSELSNVFEKNQELTRQIKSKQQQILRLKSQFSQRVSSFSPQIINFQTKMAQFQEQIKSKDEEIAKCRAFCISKQQELTRLNKEIMIYLNKINLLSEQLNKLEKLQQNRTPNINKSAQSQEANMLRLKIEEFNAVNIANNNKIEQVNAINVSLNSAIASLERQNIQKNAHNKELQRRVNILQETNNHLQTELKALVQKRRAASTISINQNDQSLIFTIRQLKIQVQQLAATNQLLKIENSQLYTQLLEQDRRTSHKNQSRTSKQYRMSSKSPHSKVIEGKYNSYQMTFHPAMIASNAQIDNYGKKPSAFSNSKNDSIISPLNSKMYRNSSPNLKGSGNRYGQLQKRIQRLQSENYVLKQHLT